jgi:4-amino-4-deoxy-L-arabinose transferase-like glycosyltransferase
VTSPRVHAILAIVVAAIHFALASRASSGKSATFDEMAHVTGGYAYWKLNDYRIQPENGNWSQRLVALPAVLSGARFPSLDQPIWTTSNFWEISDQFFFSSGNDADRMLSSARRMVALVSAVLCLLVFFWSKSLWGYAGAWVSLVLVAFSPTLLAHGGLATSDVIVAAFFIAALWALWTTLNLITLRTVLVSVVLTAGLFLAKYSAVVFIPVALTLLVIRLTRKPVKKPLLGAVVAIHLIAVPSIIWMSYGFRYSAFNPMLPPASQFIDPWSAVVRESSVIGKVVVWSREKKVLPEAYLYGLCTVDAYSRNRSAFLRGETSQRGGWRWFFPYAALIKTTLPALLLIAITPLLLLYARRRRGANDLAPPVRLPVYQLAPLVTLIAWYWSISLVSRLNIGHRHLLPVIVATAIIVGAAGEPIRRALGLMGAAGREEKAP